MRFRVYSYRLIRAQACQDRGVKEHGEELV